jgi:2-polyprenyl-3-methyl-5-hydroxy-6-metoxy-1,4-benzoquinol methylase
LLDRYRHDGHGELLSYGTVRDYCDSADHLPWLSSLQNDLKDLQRPWAVKATLGLVPIGSHLLEIGAGEPVVASLLAELGYNVTVIDPYDGSAGGPTQFEDFVRRYSNVRIIRAYFQSDISELENHRFDAIYSISVLEHVPEPALQATFQGISTYLKPNGRSFHAVDCVTQGNDAAYHFEQCLRIAGYQSKIAGSPPVNIAMLSDLFEKANQDLETYYLSPAGHNLWRGTTPYQMFPFRKVLSFQTQAVRSVSASPPSAGDQLTGAMDKQPRRSWLNGIVASFKTRLETLSGIDVPGGK